MHVIGFRFLSFAFSIKNSHARFLAVIMDAGFASISISVTRAAFMAAAHSPLVPD
jgi:hypothetical protein